MPFMSSADCASLDVADLAEGLLNPSPEAPFLQVDKTQLAALRQLATRF